MHICMYMCAGSDLKILPDSCLTATHQKQPYVEICMGIHDCFVVLHLQYVPNVM